MTKYIILACINGITKEYKFTVEEKAEAVATFKNIRMRADRCKMFVVITEFGEYWSDVTECID